MQALLNIDLNFFFFLNNIAGRSHTIDSGIVYLAEYLAYFLVIVFLLLLFASKHSVREKVTIAIAAFLSAAVARGFVTEAIRHFVHRPRPFVTHQVNQLIVESSYSFPSGHAMFFFAFSTAVYMYNKKSGTWFLIASTLLCLARIAAGVHYPSDILGGAVLGAATAWATVRYAMPLVEKILPRTHA